MNKFKVACAVAISAVGVFAPLCAFAQTKDVKLVTCVDLMAMTPEAQMELAKALVAASANALDLNDLVAGTTTIGPVLEACKANPDMMAMDAAMSLKK